jgi:hypothetical protein
MSLSDFVNLLRFKSVLFLLSIFSCLFAAYVFLALTPKLWEASFIVKVGGFAEQNKVQSVPVRFLARSEPFLNSVLTVSKMDHKNSDIKKMASRLNVVEFSDSISQITIQSESKDGARVLAKAFLSELERFQKNVNEQKKYQLKNTGLCLYVALNSKASTGCKDLFVTKDKDRKDEADLIESLFEDNQVIENIYISDGSVFPNQRMVYMLALILGFLLPLMWLFHRRWSPEF